MTDRVHPSAKSAATNGGATTTNPSFPATKAQLYGATRPTYRPQPYHRRSSRGCCCTLCFWLTLFLFFLLLLFGVAATVMYLLYRPHRPSFSITSLKLSSSEFDLTIYATNPNKNIAFSYLPSTVSILSGDVDVAEGTLPSFDHGKRNTTLLKASALMLQNDAAVQVKGSLKSKKGLALKVKVETKVEAKMGPLKTPHVGITVLCDGISVTLPASIEKMKETSESECDVDVRFKVWKWTVG